MFIFYLCIFIYTGLTIGSFITATAYRITEEKPIFTKRSYCDHCNKIIIWRNLIPVIGYIICKGRCPQCNVKVSIKYTVTEIVHCVCYVLGFVTFRHEPLALFAFCGIISILLLISIIDYETMYVYDFHLVVFTFFLCIFLFTMQELKIYWYSFALAFIPLVFKYTYEHARMLIYKEKIEVIGMADIKIFAILLFFLDFTNISLIVFLSGIFGVLHGNVKSRRLNSHFAFLPSVSFAIFFTFILKHL